MIPEDMSRNSELEAKNVALIQELWSSLSPEIREKLDDKDDIMLRVLLARDGDVAAARNLLLKYRMSRKDYKSYFASAHEAALKDVFDAAPICHPNFRTPRGEYLFYSRAGDWNTSRHSIEKIIQAMVLSMEYKSLDYDILQSGVVVVFDGTGIGWRHVVATKPTAVHALGQLLMHYIPIKVPKILVINTNWAVDAIWKIIKPVLPADLVARIHICGSDMEKVKLHLSSESVADHSYETTREMKEEYGNEILSQDHVIQSLRNRYMI